MKIFTSYFGKIPVLRKQGIVPISISLYPPKFFEGPMFPQLAPKRYMLGAGLSDEQYTRMFERDVLGNIDVGWVVKTIEAFGNGKDVAICCFERPNEFCHRHIVAKWITKLTGLEVLEYGLNEIETPKEPINIQQSLF